MKAHVTGYAELCRDCPETCKQPAWLEILKCPVRGYEHPEYKEAIARAAAEGAVEQYIPEGTEPEKLWTANQKSRVMSLAKGSCCNYCQGECLLLDGFPCVLETSMHLCCNYFRDCVLPLDKQLHAELTEERGAKKCAGCGKTFTPGSNKAKYCPECAGKRKREKHMERQRKYRDRKRDKSVTQ